MDVSQLPYSASTAEFISYKIWNVKNDYEQRDWRNQKSHSLVVWTSKL